MRARAGPPRVIAAAELLQDCCRIAAYIHISADRALRERKVNGRLVFTSAGNVRANIFGRIYVRIQIGAS